MWGWLGKQVALSVEIIRVIDNSTYPIWVEAQARDIHGDTFKMVDKLPIFSDKNDIQIPAIGKVLCTIVEEGNHGHIGPIFLVDTEQPHHVYDEIGTPVCLWVQSTQLELAESI